MAFLIKIKKSMTLEMINLQIDYHEKQISNLRELRKVKEDIKIYQGICVDVEKDPHYCSLAKKVHLEYYHKQIRLLRKRSVELQNSFKTVYAN